MNTTTTEPKKQAIRESETKLTRAQRRREVRLQEKEVKRGGKKPTVTSAPRTREQEDAVKKATEILENMKALTWRELETTGKFSKNDKLSTFVYKKDGEWKKFCGYDGLTAATRTLDSAIRAGLVRAGISVTAGAVWIVFISNSSFMKCSHILRLPNPESYF